MGPHPRGERDWYRRSLLIAAAITLFAVLGVVFVRNLTDFSVYYAAGQSLLSGRTDLYAPDFARGVVMDYRYLPFFVVAFIPLWHAPYTLAAWVWHLLDTLSIVVAVASIASIYTKVSYSRVKVWTLAFLAVVPYFAMAMDYGNAHLMTTALMFAGLSLSLRRRELPAAALLAVAITIKIVPALTLPYFAVTHRFRLLGLVAIITAALNLLPAAYFGLAGNRDLIERWYSHVIAGQEFHETNGPINLSLKGQLRRNFTEVNYRKRVDGDHRYAAVNVATFSPSTIDRVWLALSASTFAGGLVLIWLSARTRHSTSGEDDLRLEALQLGLIICLMLFVGPLTSRVYLVALLWPVVAVGVAAWDHAAVRRALIVVAILSSALPLLPGRTVQRFLLVAGTDFYVSCAVLGLVAFTLIRSCRPRRTQ
jgi:alpha-1,2-mannosyltransferase